MVAVVVIGSFDVEDISRLVDFVVDAVVVVVSSAEGGNEVVVGTITIALFVVWTEDAADDVEKASDVEVVKCDDGDAT